MTAVAATLSLEGTEEILAKFGGIAARLDDASPALAVVADNLEAHVALNFATAGARVGRPWAPLALSTIRARTRRWGYYRLGPAAGAGTNGPPLLWAGRLRGSFRRTGADHIRDIQPQSLRWGSGDPRAPFHQAAGPRRRLPRRPPLAFASDFQKREIAFTPLRLWLQGVPAGAIATVTRARLGL